MGAMKTPGVYIVEKSAFPNSVVEVATAVPAFIGYTEKADNAGKSLANKPWRITSMADFRRFFGGGPTPKFEFKVQKKTDKKEDASEEPTFTYDGKDFFLSQKFGKFLLYYSMLLFYQNGGGPCYIVSVGKYTNDPDSDNENDIGKNKLADGIDMLIKEQEPTMVVIPDAVLLDQDNCISLQKDSLAHCGGKMKNRVSILDVYDGYKDRSIIPDCIDMFRNGLGKNYLDFGAAYYPWVNTTIVQDKDLSYENIIDKDMLQTCLLDELGIEDLAIRDTDTPAEKAEKAKKAQQKKIIEVITEVWEEDAKKTEEDAKKTKDIEMTPEKIAANKSELQTRLLKELGKEHLAIIVTDTTPVDAKKAEEAQQQEIKGVITKVWEEDAEKTEEDAKKTKDIEMTPEKIAANKSELQTSLLNKLGIDVKKDTDTPAEKAKKEQLTKIIDEIKKDWDKENDKMMLNKSLVAMSPLFNTLLLEIKSQLNLLPPSAAMAGVYTMVDNSRGVWKAPANVSLNAVVSPAVNITHDEQEDLNVTPMGKSINAIRTFIGEGTLIWGARTLDGNSLDWRYINVRRTMIMLEESIRLAAKAYVFEDNVATTWVTIKSMIRNFLTGIWKRGGLAGTSPEDAFSVHVGLGETMTSVDILEGILKVTVLVALVRPAEFIEITFQQQMQKS